MSKQKLSDLAKKRGIYAGVLTGVLVIVATVMILVTQNVGKDIKKEERIDLNDSALHQESENPVGEEDIADIDLGDKTDPAQKEDIVEVPKPVEPVEKADTTKPQEDKETAKTQEDKETAETQNKEVETAEKTEKPVETAQVMVSSAKNLSFSKEDGLAWPVTGAILLPYSMDKTEYFKTLKEFMVNPALLIQGQEGTEVKAAAKGIVTNIVCDYRTGYTVTMDIGNDYKLVYGQLEKPTFKVGDLVEKGKKVGTLAKVTKYYVVEGPHLYFQVYEGENTIDPMTLLKNE